MSTMTIDRATLTPEEGQALQHDFDKTLLQLVHFTFFTPFGPKVRELFAYADREHLVNDDQRDEEWLLSIYRQYKAMNAKLQDETTGFTPDEAAVEKYFGKDTKCNFASISRLIQGKGVSTGTIARNLKESFNAKTVRDNGYATLAFIVGKKPRDFQD